MEATVAEILGHLQKRRVGSNSKNRAFNRNVSSAIFFTGHELRDLHLISANVDEIKIQRCEVFRGRFDQCTFDNVSFEDVVFASCKWNQVVFRNSSFNNVRIRKHECDAQMVDCEIDRLKMETGKLNLRIDRSHLRQVDISDCDVAMSGSVRLQALNCLNTRANFDLDNSEIKSGKFSGMNITGRFERTIIADSTWHSSSFKISGGITLRECIFGNQSDICVQSEKTNNLDLRESRFDQVTFRFFASQTGQHRACEGQGTWFINSLVLGLAITIHEYQEIVVEKRHFAFESCRGFLLLACSDASSASSGNLHSGKVGQHCGLPILTSAAFFNNAASRRNLISAVDPSCKDEVIRYIEKSLL